MSSSGEINPERSNELGIPWSRRYMVRNCWGLDVRTCVFSRMRYVAVILPALFSGGSLPFKGKWCLLLQQRQATVGIKDGNLGVRPPFRTTLVHAFDLNGALKSHWLERDWNAWLSAALPWDAFSRKASKTHWSFERWEIFLWLLWWLTVVTNKDQAGHQNLLSFSGELFLTVASWFPILSLANFREGKIRLGQTGVNWVECEWAVRDCMNRWSPLVVTFLKIWYCGGFIRVCNYFVKRI